MKPVASSTVRVWSIWSRARKVCIVDMCICWPELAILSVLFDELGKFWFLFSIFWFSFSILDQNRILISFSVICHVEEDTIVDIVLDRGLTYTISRSVSSYHSLRNVWLGKPPFIPKCWVFEMQKVLSTCIQFPKVFWVEVMVDSVSSIVSPVFQFLTLYWEIRFFPQALKKRW